MDNEKIIKINKILKWILIIGFILLAFLSIKYGFNHCDKCSFPYEGEKINGGEVWEIYQQKCPFVDDTLDKSFNFTTKK